MKFSIITTTYKHEQFIAETIDSILAQSFSDWELMIGDDSPDDATWNIIEQYTRKYPEQIRAWHHAPNRGIVENMNFLMSQVSPDSQYISFLEGDDRYTPDCLEQKINIFQKYPEVALVYSDMDFIDREGNISLSGLLRSQKTRLYRDESIATEEYILSPHSLIVSYSSVALRKSILNKYLPIQNPTGSKTYAVSDYDLFFRISRANHVFGISESLTEYRRHLDNLSASYIGLFDDLSLLMDTYYHENQISSTVYHQKQTWITLLKGISFLSQ